MPVVPQRNWEIGPITTPRLQWGAYIRRKKHECPMCGIELLTGEKPGFCCGPEGSKFQEVTPLPPLPAEYDVFINDPQISKKSRVLNLTFSFASLESTHDFPKIGGGPSFVAMEGKIYHRVRPNHQNSAACDGSYTMDSCRKTILSKHWRMHSLTPGSLPFRML